MSAQGGGPEFSLIVPVYNVAPFLPDFLTSLDEQIDTPAYELIFVDDGSTDDSPAHLLRYAADHLGTRVVRQADQGLSEARNTGLRHATGTWGQLHDPDDRLTPRYLAAVRDFLADHPVDLDLICTRPLILDDLSGTTTDSHALRRKFHPGNRLVNLAHTPSVIHLSAATGFYRRDRICASDLRFDPAIRPNFEDASFTARYLSAAQEPLLGVTADAEYLYRRRFDGSSLVQQSWSQEAKYTTVLEHGYLDLLRRCAESTGSVPLWAQNTVLYDLLFYFRREENPRALPTSLPTVWTDRFHQLVAQILSYIPARRRRALLGDLRPIASSRICSRCRVFVETACVSERIRWPPDFDPRPDLVESPDLFYSKPPQERVCWTVGSLHGSEVQASAGI